MGPYKPFAIVLYGCSAAEWRHTDFDCYLQGRLFYRGACYPYFLRACFSKRKQLYVYHGEIPWYLRNNFRLAYGLFTGLRFVILGDWIWGAAHYLRQHDVLKIRQVKVPFEKLDKAFENRLRLQIMSVLMVNDRYDFNSLKELLETTDGNLASHLKGLEKEEYIVVHKAFLGRKPNTTYKATEKGKEAFRQHLDALEKLIKQQKIN